MNSHCAFITCLLTLHCLASLLTINDAEDRLKMALQIARERNDRALVHRVEELGKAFQSTLPPDADEQLRKVEKLVGIDPGGWSMAGQPLFHPTLEFQSLQRDLSTRLAAAMNSGDTSAVRAVTTEMARALGDQAGVPDGRRAGVKPEPISMNEMEATKLFFDALETQGRVVKKLAESKPLPDQMVRLYAYVLEAVTRIDPHVKRHFPARMSELERLARGVAGILLKLQQPSGYFPFPDLRGKNIRFGGMTTQRLAEGSIEVKEGWITSTDPTGGTQFDTGVCGVALLRAGKVFNRPDWTKAGLLAADWAMAQDCCANFNYNAFSVSLLAVAYSASNDVKYREAAMSKFRVGVAPGQAANGRWLDAHNARTVYHVIILRALADLETVVSESERPEVEAITLPAITALLDEFDAMGITVEALPELLSLNQLFAKDSRLEKAVRVMAASLVAKCTDGRRVKMGAQPHQLAAVAELFAK